MIEKQSLEEHPPCLDEPELNSGNIEIDTDERLQQ